MLDPWIIEEIRKQEERARNQQPVLELPLDEPEEQLPVPEPTEVPRGVVIIDL